MNKKLIFFIIIASFFLQPVLGEEKKEVLFSGFNFKIGFQTSPETEGFLNKLIFALGADYGINEYLSWGWEAQPFFKSSSSDGPPEFSRTLFAANFFANVKAGIRMGQFISGKSLDFLKPLKIFFGIGLGARPAFSSFRVDDDSDSSFDLKFAWRIMYGFQYSLEKFSIIMEIQSVKVINKDLDPGTLTYNFIMFGLRF
jgi:hypothetical protein